MTTRDDSGWREEARRLMMAALDGEISPDQRRQLDRFLADNPELREDWERMGQVKEVTRSMSYREPPEEIWQEYWVSVYSRCERGVGWLLITLSAVVLLSWSAWQGIAAMFADSTMPLFLKLAVLGVATGAIILLVSVAREKWFVRRKDPYREVIR
jgi:ferric-dicitrate binding protein FerR (iron transport regulator)